MLFRVVLAVAGCLWLAGCGGDESSREPAGNAQAQSFGAVSARVPEGWVSEAPSSGMRKAQFRLPSGGSGEDASLVVYYFGPQGAGSVDANLERWFGQFEQPDGSPSEDRASVGRKTVDGMRVMVADVTGTYRAAAMGPMAPKGEPQPGYRMLAAIVETSQGPYYFKLTGPEKTVGRWQASFDRFVESMQEN